MKVFVPGCGRIFSNEKSGGASSCTALAVRRSNLNHRIVILTGKALIE